MANVSPSAPLKDAQISLFWAGQHPSRLSEK
jgi:hypothetical protein